MAESLSMLKSLPCPAGKNCTAFQCLFKHEGDEPVAAADSELGQTQANAVSPSQNQETPRKRVKLGADAASSPSKALVANGQRDHATKTQEISPGRKLNTVQRPISPAPLKHKAEQPTKPAGRAGAVTSSTPKTIPSKSPNTPAAASPAPKTPVKSKVRKPEDLNPRHLKKAPVGHDIRLKLLKFLHEQYKRLNEELKKDANDEESKLVLSSQDLIVKALDDEQEIATKKFAVYKNSISNLITSYKRMSVNMWKEERSKNLIEASQAGPTTAVEAGKPIETGLPTSDLEIDFLHRIAVSAEGHESYGYISKIPASEDIEKAEEAVRLSGGMEVCDRCTRRFAVFPGRREEDGALTSNGSCTFHPGKLYVVGGGGKIDKLSKLQKKYRCCDQDVDDTSGCTTADTHVFKTTDPARLASVINFATTPHNPDIPANRAVCFDCEMGYTVYGLELIRLTAVSWPSGEELLDLLVIPKGEYLDLNTRYSGVRPQDLATAPRYQPGDDLRATVVPSEDPTKPPQRIIKSVASPSEARQLFFSLISDSTPLIGHGLENDLNSLRVIHPVLLDTVLLYPHKRGLPMRNGLKYLMQLHLGRQIQMDTEDEEGNELGHDSAEDARAAGDLVKLKVKTEWQKMRLKGWSIVNGEIKAPGEGSEWQTVGKNGKIIS